MAKEPEVKKKKIYVVAGRYEQGRRYAQERIATGEYNHVQFFYVSSPEMLRGHSFPPEDVVYVGTYWENPRFTEITRQLNLVHMQYKASQP